ncbi:biopolymer transporter ExbD [Thiohalorhabdus denitrificans]|uniref:Biopolymer transport protein ExbD n=1 Tax=Thiohalorhabdus denitrificans TaxID=381306 RepID=A0A0P9C767_9GAMM|nr:biopolymer transporter ExbD [Thiohalorhabdus denitrificans]KPV39049.1 biopolymer transporter ExbD [Thiohalorhabdus denitrificans]SCX78984.1 biopolymer transport protein ExbD [Thiohalorhabdus denitrificans]
MAFGQHAGDADEPISDINVTPLVDVMLVLLVIFIILAPMFAQALRVDLPEAEAPPSAEPVVADLSVAADGTLALDNRTVSAAELTDRLKARLEEDPDLVVRLSADRSVPYGKMAQLLSRVRGAGVERIAFRTEAPEP